MGGGDDEVAVISINPKPPTSGGSATVTYTGPLPRVLNLSWTPAGAGPATIEIPSTGSAVLSIPKNGAAVKITDPTGDANALWTVIN